MKFELIVPNPDVDVHPDPPGLWQHVAVICRWKDARAQRKQWPHAAVIGPLRTVRGLDELARNLLLNNAIRVVLVVGNDLTPDEATTKALIALWKGEPEGEKHIGEDVRGPLWDVQTLVQLVCLERRVPLVADLLARWRALAQFPDLLPPWTHETKPPDYNPPCGHIHGRFGCTDNWCGYGVKPKVFRPAPHMSPLAALVPSDYESERPKVILPPPPPTANATAPAGDPGERVVGDTLTDLWPQVLHRAMRFGAERPTHYGPTRELLCLVGVVRDVEGSLDEFKDLEAWKAQRSTQLVPLKHPILGLSWAEVDAYRDRVSKVAPKGVPYSYGSRMCGAANPAVDLPCPVLDSQLLGLFPDQLAAVEKLLSEKPDTRAAFVTPWRPVEDSGKESGRPCMVGGWFRTEPSPEYISAKSGDWYVSTVDGLREVWQLFEHEKEGPCWKRVLRESETTSYEVEIERIRSTGNYLFGRRIHVHNILHLIIAFRSHDLFAAYPTNLAGILLWQSELAAKLGLKAGSLTCTSYSAHVYERDWTAAEEAIRQHYDTNREPRWDRRSTFHVELVPPVIVEKPVAVGETLHDWRDKRGDYRGPQPQPTLRATALTPDGEKVLRVFEAETPEALRAQVERSGLVTSIGAALWLGDEIRRVTGRG